MRDLGLKAYSALYRHGRKTDISARPERPEGLVIWAVVPDAAALQAMYYVKDRLRQNLGDLTLAVSFCGETWAAKICDGVVADLPPEYAAQCQAFLAHWKPDICIWIGGHLRPMLIATAKEQGLPMVYAQADEALLDDANWRWWPNLARSTLAAFDDILAVSPSSADYIRKALKSGDAVDVTAPLQIASQPPKADERTREELNEAIGGRSVWLAAGVQSGELEQVLYAQRASMRLTHRILLIMVCASFPVSIEARELLKAQGWSVCHWDDGDTIDENTQVVLVEDMDEIGLWYRLSPVSFLGGSLVTHHGACDPYVPAALGSAIIYGPKLGTHVQSYTRLAAVGAARIVNDADALAGALHHLIAADQAAAMAYAAWNLISDGAEATDLLVSKVQDLLDGHAGDFS